MPRSCEPFSLRDFLRRAPSPRGDHDALAALGEMICEGASAHVCSKIKSPYEPRAVLIKTEKFEQLGRPVPACLCCRGNPQVFSVRNHRDGPIPRGLENPGAHRFIALHHLGGRMAEGIESPCGGDCIGRTDSPDEAGGTGGSSSVMRDLDHLRGEVCPPGQDSVLCLRFDIPGEEKSYRAIGNPQDQGIVVFIRESAAGGAFQIGP